MHLHRHICSVSNVVHSLCPSLVLFLSLPLPVPLFSRSPVLPVTTRVNLLPPPLCIASVLFIRGISCGLIHPPQASAPSPDPYSISSSSASSFPSASIFCVFHRFCRPIVAAVFGCTVSPGHRHQRFRDWCWMLVRVVCSQRGLKLKALQRTRCME